MPAALAVAQEVQEAQAEPASGQAVRVAQADRAAVAAEEEPFPPAGNQPGFLPKASTICHNFREVKYEYE